jgi:hypothetical protein
LASSGSFASRCDFARLFVSLRLIDKSASINSSMGSRCFTIATPYRRLSPAATRVYSVFVEIPRIT